MVASSFAVEARATEVPARIRRVRITPSSRIMETAAFPRLTSARQSTDKSDSRLFWLHFTANDKASDRSNKIIVVAQKFQRVGSAIPELLSTE